MIKKPVQTVSAIDSEVIREPSSRNTQPSKDELEREKLAIEHQKLSFELSELRKPWFRKPTSWFAVLPTVLGVSTLIYAVASGFFANQIKDAELRNKEVQLDNRVLSMRKDSLRAEIAAFSRDTGNLVRERDALREVVSNLVTDSISFAKESQEYNRQRQEFDRQRNDMGAQIGLLGRQAATAALDRDDMERQRKALASQLASLQAEIRIAPVQATIQSMEDRTTISLRDINRLANDIGPYPETIPVFEGFMKGLSTKLRSRGNLDDAVLADAAVPFIRHQILRSQNAKAELEIITVRALQPLGSTSRISIRNAVNLLALNSRSDGGTLKSKAVIDAAFDYFDVSREQLGMARMIENSMLGGLGSGGLGGGMGAGFHWETEIASDRPALRNILLKSYSGVRLSVAMRDRRFRSLIHSYIDDNLTFGMFQPQCFCNSLDELSQDFPEIALSMSLGTLRDPIWRRSICARPLLASNSIRSAFPGLNDTVETIDVQNFADKYQGALRLFPLEPNVALGAEDIIALEVYEKLFPVR